MWNISSKLHYKQWSANQMDGKKRCEHKSKFNRQLTSDKWKGLDNNALKAQDKNITTTDARFAVLQSREREKLNETHMVPSHHCGFVALMLFIYIMH